MGVGASGVDRSSAIADEPKGVSRWVERPFAEVHEGYSDGGSSLEAQAWISSANCFASSGVLAYCESVPQNSGKSTAPRTTLRAAVALPAPTVLKSLTIFGCVSRKAAVT